MGFREVTPAYGDKEWLGFSGDDLEITIDLGEEKNISTVSTRFYNAHGQWIHAPETVSIRVDMEDGRRLNTISNVEAKIKSSVAAIEFDLTQYGSVKTRYILLTIPNFGTIPSGMQGAGNMAWTFIDEIVVE